MMWTMKNEVRATCKRPDQENLTNPAPASTQLRPENPALGPKIQLRAANHGFLQGRLHGRVGPRGLEILRGRVELGGSVTCLAPNGGRRVEVRPDTPLERWICIVRRPLRASGGSFGPRGRSARSRGVGDASPRRRRRVSTRSPRRVARRTHRADCSAIARRRRRAGFRRVVRLGSLVA